MVRQRWRDVKSRATVDFLMPPAGAGLRGGSLQDLEADLAAVITPGLRLAFRDRLRVRLEGRTLRGEKTARDTPVRRCGPTSWASWRASSKRSE